MTVQKELQGLIADIDSILSAADSRVSGSEADALARSDRVLEKVRRALVELRSPAVESRDLPKEGEELWQERVAGEIARAAIAQMNLQRATWIQPWQMELEALRQQRETLRQEIHNLAQQRSQVVENFVDVLLNRISNQIEHQIAQTIEKLETQFLYAADSAAFSDEGTTDAPSISTLPGNPSQRLEQLQQLDRESDRLLTGLDTTLRQVFGTLEQDLQAYQESLSAAIARMYDLGSQGETILTNYARSAPSTEGLQTSDREEEVPNAPAVEPSFKGGEPETAEETEPEPPASEPPAPLPDPTQFYLFPGAEIPPRDREIVSRPPQSQVDVESMNDSQIDAILGINTDDEPDNSLEAETSVNPADLAKLDESLESPEPLPDSRAEDSPSPTSPESDEAESSLPAIATVESSATDEGETETTAGLAATLLFGRDRASAESLTTAGEENVASLAADVLDEPLPKPPPVHASEASPAEAEAPPPSDRPPAERTIASLADLLEQAYTSHADSQSAEGAGERYYTPVQPGESLLTVDESEYQQPSISEQAFEQANAEKLAEDLERFEQNPQGIAECESFAPPEELVGENYEEMPLENISIDSDFWQESTDRDAEGETASMPQQISIDPWSNPPRETASAPFLEEEPPEN